MIKSYRGIWILMIFIILFTSIASSFLWDSYGQRRFTKSIVKNIHFMKDEIIAMKASKIDLINGYNNTSPTILNQYNETGNLTATIYFDEAGEKFIIDYYNQDAIIKTEYYIHRDQRPDVIEYDTDMDGIVDTIEYYYTNYGKPDVVERDSNKDGLIDNTEININVDGEFIPLSSFGNLIM